MSLPEIIIQRVRFAVHLASEQQADTLYELAGRLTRKDLTQMLESYFTDSGTLNGQSLRVDCLELDLGRVNPQTFGPRLLQALRMQLDRLFREQAVAYPPEIADLQLLEHFLRTGRLPWWSGVKSRKEMDQLVRALTVTSPQSLREQLSELLGQPDIRQRLSLQFSADTIRTINQLVWNSFLQRESPFLKALHTLLRSAALLPDTENQHLYETTLLHYLQEGGGELQSASLLPFLLGSLARQTRWSAEQAAALLLEAAREMASLPGRSAIILQLQQMASSGAPISGKRNPRQESRPRDLTMPQPENRPDVAASDPGLSSKNLLRPKSPDPSGRPQSPALELLRAYFQGGIGSQEPDAAFLQRLELALQDLLGRPGEKLPEQLLSLAPEADRTAAL